MSNTSRPSIVRFIPMVLVVCAGATFIGLIASAFAGLGYGLTYKYHDQGDVDPVLSNLAGILGTSASAIAGVAWSVIMIRRARAGADRLMQSGLRWGIALGVLATLIMHGGLIFTVAFNAPGRLDGGAAIYVGIGIVCAILAGLLMGFIGGVLCNRVVDKTANSAVPDEGIFRMEKRAIDVWHGRHSE